MKKITALLLLAGLCQAFAFVPENNEQLFEMAIVERYEFRGRATSVLDRKMQNIQSHITIRPTYVDDGFVAIFASGGNKRQHKTNVLFPTVGDVHFSVYKENGAPQSYSLRGRQYELIERDKVFYVIESDFEYEERIKRTHELNKSGRFKMEYPVTGKFMGIGHFNISGVTMVDFFEITEDNQLVEIGTFRRPFR